MIDEILRKIVSVHVELDHILIVFETVDDKGSPFICDLIMI